MSIKCGRCQQHHETVAEVQDCFTNETVSIPEAQATEKQKGFAQKLLRTRELHDKWSDTDEHTVDAMGKNTISRFISDMIDQPVKKGETWILSHPEVDAGRYALADPEDPEHITFLHIKDADDHGNPRRIYVLSGAPGQFAVHRVWKSNQANSYMDRIAEDILGAYALFGQKVGQCGVCGSPLTDQDSRDRGIGPICYGKKSS